MTEDKPMTKTAQRIIDKTISKQEIYPEGVALRLGYIESVIDRGFSDEIPIKIVLEEIFEKLSEIMNILDTQKLKNT